MMELNKVRDMRDELLRERGDKDNYVDGVLDMFNKVLSLSPQKP